MKYEYNNFTKANLAEIVNKPFLKLAETVIFNVGGNGAWSIIFVHRLSHAVQNRALGTRLIGHKL